MNILSSIMIIVANAVKYFAALVGSAVGLFSFASSALLLVSGVNLTGSLSIFAFLLLIEAFRKHQVLKDKYESKDFTIKNIEARIHNSSLITPNVITGIQGHFKFDVSVRLDLQNLTDTVLHVRVLDIKIEDDLPVHPSRITWYIFKINEHPVGNQGSDVLLLGPNEFKKADLTIRDFRIETDPIDKKLKEIQEAQKFHLKIEIAQTNKDHLTEILKVHVDLMDLRSAIFNAYALNFHNDPAIITALRALTGIKDS